MPVVIHCNENHQVLIALFRVPVLSQPYQQIFSVGPDIAFRYRNGRWQAGGYGGHSAGRPFAGSGADIPFTGAGAALSLAARACAGFVTAGSAALRLLS